jgi:hypothetical protein
MSRASAGMLTPSCIRPAGNNSLVQTHLLQAADTQNAGMVQPLDVPSADQSVEPLRCESAETDSHD